MITTGYFGIPGSYKSRDCTKVHFVRDGKPLCGVSIRPEMQYQWCANGTQRTYVECDRCKMIDDWRGIVRCA